jgi:hypothetical protein
MNATDAKKPKFDGTWWKKNKAKAADSSGKLEKALNKYKAAVKLYLGNLHGGNTKASGDPARVLAELLEVRKCASSEGTNKLLGPQQKETKEALLNYVNIAGKHYNELNKIDKLGIMTKKKVKDLVLTEKVFEKGCKDLLVSENFNFLNLMYKNPKLSMKIYAAFFPAGAPSELNIGTEIPNAMKALADKVKADAKLDTHDFWKRGPWNKAVEAVERLLEQDTVPTIRNRIWREETKDLPTGA